MIPNGGTYTFHFRPGQARGACNFDLKLVESDNTEHILSSLNLCTITGVTFVREGDHVVAQTQQSPRRPPRLSAAPAIERSPC